MRQELAKVDQSRLLAGKETTGKCEAFQGEIVGAQGLHVPIRVKGKAGRSREPWMMRDVEALSRKKEAAWVRSRQLGSSESLEEYSGCRSVLRKEIRRAKRVHELLWKRRFKRIQRDFIRREKEFTGENTAPKDQRDIFVWSCRRQTSSLMNISPLFLTMEKDMKSLELGKVNGEVLGIVHIKVEEVLDVLNGMKVNKSPGPDQVYRRTQREAREEVAGAQAEILASWLATEERKCLTEIRQVQTE
ncbi:uncharacterized protein LOC127576591 [Pristis pectinata]|uniref:uncharacterized protein LOC127576591 n=1 Tax=Pristis pectinata TaxID=685728 RepID=UPI00223CEFD1|nr:uncharacterized protein LOC127576591 [Pristis pectinata]